MLERLLQWFCAISGLPDAREGSEAIVVQIEVCGFVQYAVLGVSAISCQIRVCQVPREKLHRTSTGLSN